ncbi:MAG: hypothetical protein JW958_11010 [Candidatus Eisenbacteria bacterium]|nr:hypothetical protein [Candidatus Eisenbacteria bacterium]
MAPRAGGSGRGEVKGEERTAARDALGVLLFLGAVLILYYWRNLIGFPFERAWFWEDFLYQNFPYRAFQAVELRGGTFPLWNPYQFGGMPYAADVQAAAFYPPNLLLAAGVAGGWLAPVWVELLSVAHALLGGFFLYIFVRRFTACAYASALAGTAWALSGFFTVRMIHGNVLAVVAWLPLALLFYLRAAERRSAAAAVLGGLFFGLSLLGGSPQYSLFGIFTLGLLALYLAARPFGEGGGWRRRAIPPALAALLLLVAAGVAAIQLLPTEEMSRLSVRSEMTYEKSIECSFEPASLPTLLLPKLYGSTAGWKTGNYWGPGSYFYHWELCAYTGVLVLLLAAAAIAHGPLRRMTLFFWLLALLALLLGLGGYGPLHPLLYRLMPVYDRFRCPGRALFLTAFALTVLAGRGAALLGAPHSWGRGRKIALTSACGALFAAGTLSWLLFRPDATATGEGLPPGAAAVAFRSLLVFLAVVAAGSAALLRWAWTGRPLGRGIRAGLLGLMIAELFIYGWTFNSSDRDPDAFYRGRKEMIDLLRRESDGGLYRVKTRAPEGLILPRNMGSVNRIPSVDGYNQLKLQRYEDVQISADFPFRRMMDLLGVRVFTYYEPEGATLRLGRNTTALPKAVFYGQWETSPPGPPLLERLASPGFDPSETVLLEEGTFLPEGRGASGRATVIEWGTNRIVMNVESDGPGVLLVNEMFYPAWSARVDGDHREVRPVNHTLCGIVLEEGGERRVEMRFTSGSLRAGTAISIVTLFLSAAYLIVFGPRRGDGAASAFRADAGGEEE